MSVRQLGRFNPLGSLGEGGGGQVWRVHDPVRNREVALKVLAEPLRTPDGLLRFQQEFQLMTRLRHPGLVEAFDFGRFEDGVPFYTMEIVSGTDLTEARLDAAQTRVVLADLAQVLGYLHARGYVHADVSPGNVRRLADGRLKLMDFGLMTPAGVAAGSPRGTPAFMAPEAVRGGRLDARTDLYSLGALAYHLLTGRSPFPETDPIALMRAHLDRAPIPPSTYRPDLDTELEQVILMLLAKDPRTRFQSAESLLRALEVESTFAEEAQLLVSHFVGRQDVMGDVHRRLADLAAGKGGALWFTGPSGTGKSRLLEEVRLQAQLAGAIVLAGTATETPVPYGPLHAPLRTALSLIGPKGLSIERSALAGLLPELGADHVALDPKKERLRLQHAILAVLTTLTERSPLVLLLDDWQWADSASLDLLAVLSDLALDRPLLLVGASRSQVPEGRPLPPLGPSEVAELAGSMLGASSPPSNLVDWLVERSAGLPLAVERLMRHLAHESVLRPTREGWRYDVEAIAASSLPTDWHAVFDRQIQGLSEGARRVAQAAAAIGRPFAPARLEAALPDFDLLAGLAELEHEALLVRSGDRVWFVSAQQVEAVQRATLPDESVRLHTALARALAGATDLEALNDLARHALSGERPETGVAPSLEAARRDLAVFALQEARWLLAAALPHARDRESQLAAWHLLGDIERVDSHLEQAERCYESSLELGPDRVTEGVIRTNYGVCAQIRQDYKTALERYGSARQALAGLDDLEWLRCVTFEARTRYFKGDLSEAMALCEGALPKARSVGDPLRLAGCLGLLGMLYALASDRPREGVALLQEALAVSEPLGDKIGLNDTLNLLGNAQLALGDYRGAEESFGRTLVLSQETAAKSELVAARINLAQVALERGHAERAAQIAKQASEEAAQQGNRLYAGLASLVGAVAATQAGRIGAALEALEAIRKDLAQAADGYLELAWRSHGAEVHLLTGRLIEATQWGELALAAGRQSGNLEYEARTTLVVAEAEGRLGEGSTARRTIKALLPRTTNLGREAAAQYLLAWLAYRAGQVDEANRMAAEALEKAEEAGLDGIGAQIHLLLGELSLQVDDRSGALNQFAEAHTRASTGGLPLLDCQAQFGRALALGHSPDGQWALKEARTSLGAILASLDPDQRADLLSLAELWRIQQGDLELPRYGGRAEQTVSERRYLEALERERKLAAELQELQAVRRRADVLTRFTSEIQATMDLEALKEGLVGLIAQLLDAKGGHLLLADDSGELHSASSYGPVDTVGGTYSRGITRDTLSAGETIFVPDVQEESRYAVLRSVTTEQFRSVLSLPLRVQDRMIGVIFVGRTEVAHDFSDEDRLLAEAIAHLAAQAIENARLYTESRNQARQLQISNHLARKVSTSLVRSEVLDVAVSSALELTGADRAMIVLRQADGSLSCEMARDAQGPLDPSTIAYSQSLCQKVLATEEPIIHLDTAQHEDLKAQRSIMANELRTVMGVPLMGRTEPMGVLYVDSQKVVNAFGPAELDLLGAIGSQAAIAITNAQLYEKATVDALTRLYVRSFFEQRLLHEVNRALRYGSSVSVLMMDIDHFKKFNDTYGHAVGDQVLRHVAGVIKGAIRQDLDVAARFGGEEMLVLMPDTGPDGAVATAERLRQAIASSGLEQAAGDPLQVMVSIGVSSLSPELSTPVELIEAADAALYQSKRNGRNRVTAFEPGMTAKI